MLMMALYQVALHRMYWSEGAPLPGTAPLSATVNNQPMSHFEINQDRQMSLISMNVCQSTAGY